MSKRLGGIKGCKYKTSSWHLNGFPYGGTIDWVNSIISGMAINNLSVQYNGGLLPDIIHCRPDVTTIGEPV